MRTNRAARGGGQPDQRQVQELVALVNAGRLVEAEAKSRKLIKKFPGALIIYNVLGASLTGQQKFDRAVACYSRLVKIVPDYPEGHYNLGSAQQKKGDLKDAAASYRTALKLKPDLVEAHSNLGVILQQLNDVEGAVASFRQALRLRPGFADAHLNLGNALRAQGALEEAARSYRAALELSPDLVEAHFNLGRVLSALESNEQAEESLRRVLELDPDHARARHALAGLLVHRGQRITAISQYRRVIELEPDFAEAHDNLGYVLAIEGHIGAALKCHRRALDLDPESASAHSNLGYALMLEGCIEEALSCQRRALTLDPKCASAHINLGSALEAMGDLEDAIEHYRLAIALAPELPGSYRNLARAGANLLTADEVAAMKDLYEGSELFAHEKMQLAFALAKLCEDTGDYDDAFAYLEAGNRQKRSGFEYDIADAAAEFSGIKRSFIETFAGAPKGAQTLTDVPIFILGMPRCGSTLVEQIVASHPEVTGAGETGFFLNAVNEAIRDYPDDLSALDEAACLRVAAAYLDKLQAAALGAPRITDKSLYNFKLLGLIRTLFPQATIIHVQRDPMDTCFSIFGIDFAGHLPHAYDLQELGTYYRLYEDLMNFWRQHLPGGFYEQSYEQLVAEPEKQIRNLLEVCGLPFDEACLSFYQTKRPVLTASVTQVRRPIYKDSVARWRHFASHLEPLQAALRGGDA